MIRLLRADQVESWWIPELVELQAKVPPSERWDLETFLAKVRGGAFLCYEFGIARRALIVLEPLEDAEGGRYFHVVALVGKGFNAQVDRVVDALRWLGRELGVRYYTFQTARPGLVRVLQRAQPKELGRVYRVEV